MSIKEAFDNIAKEYDKSRRILIPCFDEFYGVAVKLLKTLNNNSPKILDLGVGTGLLSAFVLAEYPNAEIVGVDMSGKMLQEAQKRFSAGVELIKGDYLSEHVGDGYDAVISSLSIHHLEGVDKLKLFNKMHKIMNNNAVFINADQVLGNTEYIESVYRKEWYEQMRELGVTEEVLLASEERMKEDKMSTLYDQLNWLAEAGFSDVECWYKNYIFVVYAGRKLS